MQKKLTTRFAPSPTGFLHIGGLRTALYNYLYARKNGGKFLLRIEDTDLKRNSAAATKAIIEAFEWCGLDYDAEPSYQSQRFAIYEKFIQKLLDEGRAYHCYMSKEELDALRKQQEARKERPRYDGRYRDFSGEPPAGVCPVVRLRAPESGELVFEDGIKGEIRFAYDDIMDDFIIARSDGSPTYNFCVVVDDALMGVSAVIRGDDHLSNTPKQIVLYEALGFEIPQFFHVAMIHGEDGKKLSKRHGAMDVMAYKNMGILPQALLNFLVRLGWGHHDEEIFSLRDLERLFDPHHISKSASSYSFKKLEWLNTHYIKTLPFEEINRHLKGLGFDLSLVERGGFLLDLLRERAKTLRDIICGAKSILERPQHYDAAAVAKFVDARALILLREFAESLRDERGALEFEELAHGFLEKRGAKLKDLAQPLRIALTGAAVSPSIFEVLEFLGVEVCRVRVGAFVKFCESLSLNFKAP